VGHPCEQAGEARPSDRSERLAAAVVALPPRVRAALVLRLLDDLSEGDTARVLRCPAPEVAALVRGGKRAAELAVAGGRPAPARLGELDPWGGARITGVGRPPWFAEQP
jgi:DNA-directed RNA polymerase specialized sigma24 family protein